MSGHTPGPWIVNNEHTSNCLWRVEPDETSWVNDGWIVAELRGPDAQANARLIAAAPDLLAALEAMVNAFVCGSLEGEEAAAVEVGIAALAKARGHD